MTAHVCLGAADPLNFCEECFCIYCQAPLIPGAEGRCSDSSCENHWRAPTGRDHRGFLRSR